MHQLLFLGGNKGGLRRRRGSWRKGSRKWYLTAPCCTRRSRDTYFPCHALRIEMEKTAKSYQTENGKLQIENATRYTEPHLTRPQLVAVWVEERAREKERERVGERINWRSKAESTSESINSIQLWLIYANQWQKQAHFWRQSGS